MSVESDQVIFCMKMVSKKSAIFWVIFPDVSGLDIFQEIFYIQAITWKKQLLQFLQRNTFKIYANKESFCDQSGDIRTSVN